MQEMFDIAITQTAIFDENSIIITPTPTPKPKIMFGEAFTFQIGNEWCIYNKFNDEKGN